MSKLMILWVQATGSNTKDSTTLEVTEEEWNRLSEDKQKEIIGQSIGDVIDIWVAPDEGDE